MWWEDDFSLSETSPDSLVNLSIDVISKNLHTITEIEHTPSRWRQVRRDVLLPTEVWERFLGRYQKNIRLGDSLANIFRDRNRTRLKSVKLRNARITEIGLKSLMEHKPVELELVQCEYLNHTALEIINRNSENLVSLKFGPLTPVLAQSQDDPVYKNRGYLIKAPRLKRLTIQHTRGLAIYPLADLTHLDLSNCTTAGSICALNEMNKLVSLNLHNVIWSKHVIDWIAGLKSLTHLDISQQNDRYGKYYAPNEVLAKLATNLPNLESLDISGTNLAGSGAVVLPHVGEKLEDSEMAEEEPVRCDIPGLVCRVNNPLRFLGLYGTLHGACNRHDIPALTITGDANGEQILTAATVYMDRPVILTRALNDLYFLFRYKNNTHLGQALAVVLKAMDQYLAEKDIQISGSAILFYILKSKERASIASAVKRRIVTALLVGMEAHLGDDTLMRNGCLTLCQFRIPNDVLFQYERVVLVLLNGVSDSNQEGFVQRIAIYLLNSLACQVDVKQKRFLGNHGAIGKMFTVISDRLERGVCDDVMEVAWSAMWNVTDETPQNCRLFFESRGMEYFLACLKKFPNKQELLRNMMGLLGNVAEVAELRSHLMNHRFLSVFNELLDSASDGIEVSYNAAGVLAHMASDGQQAWTVPEVPRDAVLDRVAAAVDSWDLRAERNINYRSFEPILNLLNAYHTPQCQHWAVWALANLTTVYPVKYCGLVVEEGGMVLLERLVAHPEPYPVIKELARAVMHNCRGQTTPLPPEIGDSID